jgi:uncharacterized protein YrrD
MLLLGSRLIGTPVMGLQTGTKLAHTASPLIDPANLKIVAYIVEGPLLSEHPSLIRMADVRELSDIGMIVDSSDEFIALDDVVKIKELYDLHFNLIGLNVIDESKHKLGKIDDYSLDSSSFIVEQLNVRRRGIRSFTETGLLIHRSQIVEINNQSIVVKTTATRVEVDIQPERRSYVNPFRTAPQVEQRDSN